MARQPVVPEELRRGPFTVDQALRSGLSRRQLEGRSWKRLSTGRYIWTGLADHPLHVLRAAHGGLPREAAFSGVTAGWLHGLDLRPTSPIEVTIPPGCGVSQRAGVRLRRSALAPTDIVVRQRLPTTSRLRTTFDLARHLAFIEAVVAVDMALHNRLTSLPRLRDYVAAHAAFRGAAQARKVVKLAEPRSESPMETRLRLLLINAGLPRPQAQAELRDERAAFVARVDLYYPDQRLAIEYDGSTHRDSLVADNRRQNRLLAAGYRLLRFTAADVQSSPAAVAAHFSSPIQIVPPAEIAS
jgi:very-short-patch-repair endonuclease